MKRKILLIICCLLMFISPTKIYAATGSLSVKASSSVTVNKAYDVTVSYSGTTLGSLSMKITVSNATCSISSTASGGTSNTTSSGFEISYFSTSGYKSGTTLAKLSCKSTKTGTAKITASPVSGDAYDIEGIEEITVSSGSKSITVAQVTTTTKKTTTKKTTTSKKPTSTQVKTTTTNPVEGITNPTISMTTTTTTSTTTPTTTEPITENMADVKDNYKLSSLKIVGFDIEFDKNQTGYEIEVPESIEEVYIIAEAVDLTKKIANTGIVNIKDKDEIIVRVYDEETNTGVSYKILLTPLKNINAYTYFLPIINGILILIIIALLFKNKNKNNSKPKLDKLPEQKNDTKKVKKTEPVETTDEVKIVSEKREYFVNAPLKNPNTDEDIVIDEDVVDIKPL